LSGNILVVDDDPDVVEILTESLKIRGYSTEAAYDGMEAVEKYDAFHPDLVVLDILLPEKNGFEVCEEIRARDIHRDVPIIIISANSIPDSMVKVFSAGAQDYIKKPFSVKEIIAKIDNFLSQAHKRKDLREQNLLLEDEIQKGLEEYFRVNRTLKKKSLDMKTLFGLSQDLNRLMDPDELINIFSLTVIGQLGIGSVSLFYAFDETSPYFSYAGGKGSQGGVLASIRLSREVGLSSQLLKTQDIMGLEEETLDEGSRREAEFLVNFGFEYCFPLIVKSRMSGIVFIGRKINGQDYSEEEFELFKSICNSAATGLENSRLFSELQSTYLSTIKVLVSTIEAKDAYTRGHTERVADYAKMLAEAMGLSKRDREIVSFGAALHDIGKLGVYENILNKPGALTESEWEIVKSHPEVGANIIKNMKFLEAACDLVRHHHERLDGKGYPDGLHGKEISVGARIVAVADSFDAMTSDRPYRKAYTIREAMEQLKKQQDKFDQDVVSFLEMLVTKGRIMKSGL
jgi:putative nucleotidyltransferase with HDIG domain